MLSYAAKLTRQPKEISERDLDALRQVGFNDAAISDIAVSTAMYAFMNRVVDGLGRELPRGMDREAERLGLVLPNGIEKSDAG